MTKSTIIPLVRYVSIFGVEWWLTRDEAAAKLAHESALYVRWRDFPEVQPPRIG